MLLQTVVLLVYVPVLVTEGQKLLLVKKFQVATGTVKTTGRVVKALA